MRLKGAIFDMDGTILDSLGVWRTLGSRYLLSIGYEPKPTTDRLFKNFGMIQAADYYRSEYGVEMSVEEILDGINTMIEQFYLEEAQLKPGVTELLERLREAGVRMCLATATDRYLAEPALERCGVRSYFGGIFTCGEAGHGKDEPHIYEAALRFLGTPREDTMVFEDALYAVRTAREAGFLVAAVHDPSEKRQEEIRELSDVYLDRIDQFRPM